MEFFFNSYTTINDDLLHPWIFHVETSHSIKKCITVLGMFISYLSIVQCPLFPWIFRPNREFPSTRRVTGPTSDRKHPRMGGHQRVACNKHNSNFPAKLCFATIGGDSSPEDAKGKKRDKNPCPTNRSIEAETEKWGRRYQMTVKRM